MIPNDDAKDLVRRQRGRRVLYGCITSPQRLHRHSSSRHGTPSSPSSSYGGMSQQLHAAAAAASGLFLIHLDDVIVLHLQRLGRLVIVDAAAVEQKPQ